jgi:predicted DNA-binding protein (MmcQ/YjbR family)
MNMPPRPLAKLRKLCLALPEAHEVEAWGEPTFRMRNKLFAMYANAQNHHGNGRHAVWIKSQKADQARLIKAAPESYFVPPYVGKGGWIGAWLDSHTDWNAVAEFLTEGYRMTAPPRLTQRLNDADER